MTLDDLREAVVAQFGPDEWDAWIDFRKALLNNEAVKLGDLWAMHQAENVDVSDTDSYGEYTSELEVWMVFSVGSPRGTSRYFKKQGWTDSYGGFDLGGKLTEVERVDVSKTTWKAVK